MSVRNYVIDEQGERHRHYLDVFARKPLAGYALWEVGRWGEFPPPT
jgi:hypothetical protein